MRPLSSASANSFSAASWPKRPSTSRGVENPASRSGSLSAARERSAALLMGLSAAGPPPPKPRLRRNIENEGDVGQQAADRKPLQGVDQPARHAGLRPLIGARGIE